jgi:hypothetical protein
VGILKFFRNPPRICDPAALADFIDQNAAFLVQKGIYEYSRARAGHYAKVLFREQGFQLAVDESRWRAYPLGLLMVAELVEGVLLPYVRPRNKLTAELSTIVCSVFDRYPIPAALGAHVWTEARAELVRGLQHIGLHPPKRAFEICDPWADRYFNLMPIDQKLRRPDYPTICNYLRVILCNIHDEFSRRVDPAALTEQLSGGALQAR